ncbi:hypothetical protein R1sor_007504 [Riccia sorocarpa]|uniref:Reverse transcriptase domain-containing protein n=1 Tax=Riccia sorocarpa TaxID=122646 RepID=A0ABD3HR08_9MARC
MDSCWRLILQGEGAGWTTEGDVCTRYFFNTLKEKHGRETLRGLQHPTQIVGKIMASRLRDLIANLIDDEQTGFISGRSIMDNIVCAKLSQDYAEETREPAIFCKLDFVKAFDRVQHEFLWETLRAMHCLGRIS